MAFDAVPDFVRALPDDGRGKLAVFDADGTLWRDDVADDFCRWMIDTGQFSDELWDEYLQVYRADHPAGCEYMLKLYAGRALAHVHAQAEVWWRDHAHRDWIPETAESVRWLAERDYTCWVVTGTPTPAMGPLLDLLPFERVLGMDAEVDAGGVITGRLSGIRNAGQGKADKIRSLWTGGEIVLGAGNGTLDTAMVELATHVRWAVFPNPDFEDFARAKGWHVLSRPADFVEEDKLA